MSEKPAQRVVPNLKQTPNSEILPLWCIPPPTEVELWGFEVFIDPEPDLNKGKNEFVVSGSAGWIG